MDDRGVSPEDQEEVAVLSNLKLRKSISTLIVQSRFSMNILNEGTGSGWEFGIATLGLGGQSSGSWKGNICGSGKG